MANNKVSRHLHRQVAAHSFDPRTQGGRRRRERGAGLGARQQPALTDAAELAAHAAGAAAASHHATPALRIRSVLQAATAMSLFAAGAHARVLAQAPGGAFSPSPLSTPVPDLPSDIAPLPLVLCNGNAPGIRLRAGQALDAGEGSDDALLMLDTGSPELVMASDSVGTANVQAYEPSSEAEPLGNATMHYGSANLTGTVYVDRARLAADDAEPVEVPILRADADTWPLMRRDCQGVAPNRKPFDGILGLGPTNTSVLADLPTFRTSLGEAAGKPGAFALSLCGEGALYPGGYNANATRGPMRYFDMVSALPNEGPLKHLYATRISGLSLGNVSLMASDAPVVAVWDSGTNKPTLPQAMFDRLAPQAEALFGMPLGGSIPVGGCLEGDETYAGLDDKLPPLTITLQDQTGVERSFSLPPSKSYIVPGNLGGAPCYEMAMVAQPAASPLKDTVIFGSPVSGLTVAHDPQESRLGLALCAE